MPKKRRTKPEPSTSATVGYEAEPWQMADALRGSMDAAEYKHVVLGLISSTTPWPASSAKIGDEASRAKDVLGRVYEYFLSQFASAEGKKGGEGSLTLPGMTALRRAMPRSPTSDWRPRFSAALAPDPSAEFDAAPSSAKCVGSRRSTLRTGIG
jgi:hypothetical protein